MSDWVSSKSVGLGCHLRLPDESGDGDRQTPDEGDPGEDDVCAQRRRSQQALATADQPEDPGERKSATGGAEPGPQHAESALNPGLVPVLGAVQRNERADERPGVLQGDEHQENPCDDSHHTSQISKEKNTF